MAKVTNAAGFCNQAHHNNDFTDIMGEPPDPLIRQHRDSLPVYRHLVLCRRRKPGVSPAR